MLQMGVSMVMERKIIRKILYVVGIAFALIALLGLNSTAYAEEKNGIDPSTADAPAPSGEDDNSTTKNNAETKEVEVETPASVTGKKVDGTGTVTDFSTSGSKAFYTITDRDSNTFYLIVDMDKTENNVYFLSDINKATLEGTATSEDNAIADAPAPAPTEQGTESAIAETPDEEESGGSLFYIIMLGFGLLVIAYYYFFVLKKKQKQKGNQNDEDDDDEDYDGSNEVYEDENYEAEYKRRLEEERDREYLEKQNEEQRK